MEVKTALMVFMRYAIAILGALLVARGVIQEADITTLQTVAELAAGFVMAVVPPLYAIVTRPSAKAMTAAKAIDRELAPESPVIIKTPEGRADIRVPGRPPA